MLNSKSKEDKQGILKLGMKTEFWELIVEAMEESKEAIEKNRRSDDMKALPADDYKLENELFNAKIKFIDKLKNTPQNLIDHLEKPNNEEDDFDPYN